MLPEIARTLKHEGRLSLNKNDAGGATNFGISLRFLLTIGDRDKNGTLDYDLNHDGNVDAEDIKLLTEQHAHDLIKSEFYDPLRISEIKCLRIRWKVLDLAVNMGKDAAARIFQRAVGVKEDGVVGSLTIDAANRILAANIGEAMIMDKLVEQQVKRYVSLAIMRPANLAFLVGWTDRAFDRGKDLVNASV